MKDITILWYQFRNSKGNSEIEIESICVDGFSDMRFENPLQNGILKNILRFHAGEFVPQ